MKRVIFTLTMPGVGSWNGKWTGESNNYQIIRELTKEQTERLELNGSKSWSHRWEDGWCARVTGRIMNPGERLKPSDGFYGYEWMVDNIIKNNSTYDEEA